MKYPYKMLFSILILANIIGCGEDLAESLSDDTFSDTTTSNSNPDDAVTQSISFDGGTRRQGVPPSATNNAGDPYLTEPISSSNAISPGSSATLPLRLNNMSPNQSFNVNIQFGSSTQYINIPISASVIGNNTGGTLNLPFSMPSNVCNNISDIQHQIRCYESVDIGNGVKVSKQTARTMLLACNSQSTNNNGNTGSGTFATGSNDFCVSGYPREACTLLQTDASIAIQFTAGSGSCSSLYPNTTEIASYNYCEDGSFQDCGVCALQISQSKASKIDVAQAEDKIYNELFKLESNPELRKFITFTPDP